MGHHTDMKGMDPDLGESPDFGNNSLPLQSLVDQAELSLARRKQSHCLYREIAKVLGHMMDQKHNVAHASLEPLNQLGPRHVVTTVSSTNPNNMTSQGEMARLYTNPR